MALHTFLLVIALNLVVDHGVTQGVDNILNTELDECLQLVSRSVDPSNSTTPTLTTIQNDIEMQSTCLQEFVWKFGGINWADFNITEHDIKYINELTHSLVSEHSRVKRQIGPNGGPPRMRPMTGFRIRREYRRLTDRDRYMLNNAFRVMKMRGEYDTFANLHRGAVTDSAHNGPNFLGWHRVYLALVEEALRRINRRVALAYWDSSLDFDMDNPVNSILWSTPFLGNGDGFVTTGPFANWVTPVGNLARNIGGGSRLISKEVIRDILTRCRTSEISVPTAAARYNLELHHGGPHVWVGGQFSGLDTAAHDPVFFLHHAFIDYIWELFRIRQAMGCGVNPVTDYPSAIALHDRNRPMDAFPQYRNIDGYRAYWTTFWYRYERSPTCSPFMPYCGTPYLRCDMQRRRCVSVARRLTVPRAGASAGAMAFGAPSAAESNRAAVQANSLPIGRRFAAPASDGRTADAGFRGKRRKRAANQTVSEVYDFASGFPAPLSDGRTSDALGYNIAKGVPSSDQIVLEPDTPGSVLFQFAKPMPLIPIPEYPAMMNEQLAGSMFQRQDLGGSTPAVDDTVYVPVKVIYERQDQMMNTMRNCQIDTNGAMHIHIRAQGLSYIGMHDEYTLIDARQAVSTSMAYMAVKLPTNATSEVLIKAIDGCGRICQARCLDNKYAERTFRNCDGVLHVDENSTFGKMRKGAIETGLRDTTKAAADTSRNADIQFLCPAIQRRSWSTGQTRNFVSI